MNYFIYNGNRYGIDTIVKTRETKRKDVGFNKYLVFVRRNSNNTLHFRSMYSCWENYDISENKINEYIESIAKVKYNYSSYKSEKINPAYIEGIVSAWIIYILVMFAAIFLKGTHNMVGRWAIASVIFWNWRNKKINGGWHLWGQQTEDLKRKLKN